MGQRSHTYAVPVRSGDQRAHPQGLWLAEDKARNTSFWPALPFPPELHLLAGPSLDPRPLPGGDPCLGLTGSLRMFVSSEVTIGQELTPRPLNPLPACFSSSPKETGCTNPAGLECSAETREQHPGGTGGPWSFENSGVICPELGAEK